MWRKWKRELEKQLKADEASKGDIFLRIERETFSGKLHNMQVKDGYARSGEYYDFDLEKADLIDLENLKIYDGNKAR